MEALKVDSVAEKILGADFPVPKAIYDKVAWIIETRANDALLVAITNALSVLDMTRWKVHAMLSKQASFFVRKHLGSSIDRGDLIISEIAANKMVISEYSQLCSSSYLWERMIGEIILVFQTDTCLCSTPAMGLDHFVDNIFKDYDYVGAPWKGKFGGNGGLSLRRRSAVLEMFRHCVAEMESTGTFYPEDVAYVRGCKTYQLRIPPASVSSLFSVEQVLHPAPIGLHKPWKDLTRIELTQISATCREVHRLLRVSNIEPVALVSGSSGSGGSGSKFAVLVPKKFADPVFADVPDMADVMEEAFLKHRLG